MIDVLLDTLFDTLKLLPFLFLSYLLMEYMEHRGGAFSDKILKSSGKIGPLFGATLGIIPQCGISAGGASLYCGRMISAGTLIAVFLSASDEMLPILISESVDGILILKILGFKWLFGMIAGFITDMVFRLCHKNAEAPQIEELCEREHCHCGQHFALSALHHTLGVTIYLVITIFALNTLIYLVGEESLEEIANNNTFLTIILSALVGFIPNCASSVVLTEMFLHGILPASALFSGLLVNAGVGTLVLVRGNRPLRNTATILVILLFWGLFFGCLIWATPLSGFLAL